MGSGVALFTLSFLLAAHHAHSAIGVNWGTLSFHKLRPSTVVDLLKANKITKVKLFDSNPDALRALMGTGIQVMISIPNELLSTFSSDLFVQQNLSRFMGKGGADIRYSIFYQVCVFMFLYAHTLAKFQSLCS